MMAYLASAFGRKLKSETRTILPFGYPLYRVYGGTVRAMLKKYQTWSDNQGRLSRLPFQRKNHTDIRFNNALVLDKLLDI